jgi:hypothetical protein
MKRFEIKFKGKTIYTSVDKGFIGVIVSQHKATVYLSIGGYDKSNYITWYSDKIDEIEEVTVKVVDVIQNSEPIAKT